MNKLDKAGDDQSKPFLLKAINSVANGFLAISLLLFFIFGLRTLFGVSEWARYSTYILGTVFSGIAYKLICHSFTGFVVLLLFAFPALALALTFLLL